MFSETKRLYFRPWEESDAKRLYQLAKDPDVGPMAGWPAHTSLDQSFRIICTVLREPENYAVVLKKSGLPVGSIGLLTGQNGTLQLAANEAEIGYWIGKEYWGQGLIPEAVRELQRYCFEELGYGVLWCGYYEGNIKSQKAQEKCGFVYHHTEYDKLTLLGDTKTEHFTRLSRENWEGLLLSELPYEKRCSRFPISLTDHNEKWKDWYAQEADAIRLAVKKIKLYHIGSTAVEGIKAKAVVDILVEAMPEDHEEVKRQLFHMGYTCSNKGKQRMDFVKGYVLEGLTERVFHLHLRKPGDNDEIYFCRYLQRHEEKAREYEELKLLLEKQFKYDRDGYTEAKKKIVSHFTESSKREDRI